MPTTFNVFDLGFSASVLDPTEGNTNNEGASLLVGQTFGSAANPLRNALVQFSAVSFSGGTTDAYDVNNSAATDTFSINGGPAQSFDAFVAYSATITYTDGTSITGTVQIFQSTSGQLFAVPSLSVQDLTARPVASFTLNSVTTFDGTNMAADRPVIGSGTAGADALSGTAGNDYQEGFGGNDTLSGGDGNDTLYGGSGNDTVAGGNGNDTIWGEDGNDTLSGEAGADSIAGGTGADSAYGGAGNDTIVGGSGGDTLFGGDDADLITSDGAENILINGSFEVGQASNSFGFYSSVGGWTNATGGTIEIWGSGTGADGNAVDGNNFLELDNDVAVDTIRQDVQTLPGESYTLSFSAQQRGSGTDSIEVWWRGTLIGTITPTAGWSTYSFTVTGSGGSDRLEFREPAGQSNAFGPYLDDVRLVGAVVGADLIDAGAGDDTVFYGAGNDTVFGGSGNDVLDDNPASGWANGDNLIYGGEGNDTVFDSAGNDTVFGDAGNDQLNMNSGGNDLVDGGAGSDTIFAGAGNDTITGGTEADSLRGDAGDDVFRMTSTAEADTIAGGESGETTGDVLDASAMTQGANVTFTGAEAGTFGAAAFSQIERVILGSGNDTVTGFSGNDSVDAGAGDDQLSGDAGNDTLAGGLGNDSLSGGDGADQLDGGAGRDTLRGGAGADTLLGGIALDFADYSDSTAAVSIDLAAGTASGGTATGDVLVGIDGIIGSSQNDTLLGWDAESTNPDDTFFNILIGGAGDDLIDGRGGIDSPLGDAGRDTILGGLGNDTLDGGADNDSLQGEAGSDSILGGSGADTLEGGADSDTLWGDAGSDRLFGGLGADTLFGGDGDDVITFGGGDSAEGGAGDDRFVLSQADGTSPDTTVRGGETGEDLTDTLNGGRGDILDVSNVAGANQSVIFTGNEQGRVVGSSPRVDFFEIEQIVTGSGNDTIDGAAGTSDQTFTTNDGADVVSGSGNDSVDAGTGNDSIQSGAGNDTVNAGAGNDSITAGSGSDTISGGSGDDTVFVGENAGNDLIQFDETGETSGDLLNAQSMTSAATLTFGAANSGALQGGGTNVTFFAVERVFLGSGNDTVTASAVSGGVLIDAGAGNDDVLGGTGGDNIWGGSGNDTINGGLGADLLQGSDGDDTFVIENGFGADTINGGFSGQTLGDMLDASRIGAAMTVNLTGVNAGSLTDGTSTLQFNDVERLNLGTGADTVTGSSGVDRVFGNAGNDSINAGAGNDIVDGGADNDTVTGGDGADTLTGGTGNDSLTGDLGADQLSGDDGNDTLAGGDGDDTLLGGAGSDRLVGGAGVDRLQGGAGADSFVVDGTADRIIDFDTTSGIGNGTSADNDFVDLTAYFNDTALAAWNAANPGQTFGNALAWLQFDAQDGVLDQAGGLRIENGGTAVAAGSLRAENTGVICFARGTAILTDRGDVAVEDLQAGDQVWTLDNGYQPIRWIGASFVPAMDRNAPVVIEAGVLGNRRALRVSPQHKMLIDGPQVELHFAAESVLVPAKALVDGIKIRREPALFAQYFHILMDRHEVLAAEGALSESFLPGAEGWKTISPRNRESLAAAMPALAQGDFAAYGSAARMVLTVAEGRLVAALRSRDTIPLAEVPSARPFAPALPLRKAA